MTFCTCRRALKSIVHVMMQGRTLDGSEPTDVDWPPKNRERCGRGSWRDHAFGLKVCGRDSRPNMAFLDRERVGLIIARKRALRVPAIKSWSHLWLRRSGVAENNRAKTYSKGPLRRIGSLIWSRARSRLLLSSTTTIQR